MAVTNIKTVVEATVAPQIIALELKYKSAIDEARSIVEKQDKIIANNATIAGDTQLAVNKISEEVKKKYEGYVNMLQIDNNEALAVDFGKGSALYLLMKESDLKFGNWKRSVAFLG